MKLKTKRQGKKWWLVGDPDGPYGPYNSRGEAINSRDALDESMKDINIKPGKLGCWTTDDRKWTNFQMTTPIEERIANAKDNFVSGKNGSGPKKKTKRRKK